MSKTCREVAAILRAHGDMFTGVNSSDEARAWVECGFTASEVDAWCGVGCWDAATAAALRRASLTPERANKVCEFLIAEEQAEWLAADEAAAEADMDDWTPCDQVSRYTDDPMYSICNGDTGVALLIEAAKDLA